MHSSAFPIRFYMKECFIVVQFDLVVETALLSVVLSDLNTSLYSKNETRTRK
jgi:hypothetical protein